VANKNEIQKSFPFTYMLCVRNVKDGKFGTDFGDPLYLKVPRGKAASPKDNVGANTWFQEVRDLADGLADGVLSLEGDVLVLVHGYNNTPEDIAQRHELLQDDLSNEGWRGVVVSFDWPCEDSTLNYLEDREDAAKTAQFLVTHGIKLIIVGQIKHKCETNIHLLGHSTGAYVIMESFSAAQKVGGFFKQPWRIGQVAFIGGDVSAGSLDTDSDWGKPMFERIMRLTNYSNGFDDVLGVSNAKRLGTSPRVGRVGLTEQAHPKAVNVNCSEYFQNLDPKSQKQKLGWWNHSWHIGNPVWTRDLAMTMEGLYDRNVLPTREKRPDGLYLVIGDRPRFESNWRRLVTAYDKSLPATDKT
jgi:pimeloyl-ACP methyl ester carboxylesterase